MRRKKQILMLTSHIILLSLAALLLISSIGFKRDGPTVSSVTYVDHVQASVNNGPWTDVTLPHNFRDLEPRTPVSIQAFITPKHDDGVYIKTVYSPAKVYLDNKLFFEFGKKENYPDFMVDPATEIHIVETYADRPTTVLRVDFLSPVSRSTLTVHPPIVGTSKELIMERSRMLGFPFMFSVVQMIGGVSLILISICITFIDKKGILFLWLGFFSFMTGAWAFGENNFSGVIFRDSTFLYLLSFIGLFTFIVPLLRFTRTIIGFEKPGFIWGMELFFALSACAALFLQFTGLVACSKSMYFFHALLPPALVILTVLTVREAIRYKNRSAQRFILPIGVLAISALLELFNYNFPFTFVFSSLFQMGILFFLLVMGITAGLTIKDSINLKNTQKELAFEQNLMNIQIKEQKNRSELLEQHEELLRQQRHDLRHHLVAIQEMAEKDPAGLKSYLQDLNSMIPTPSQASFCENRAVSSVIAHYHTLCQQEEIELTLNLVVPPCREDGISESELCVIFGNLLENAVEACQRMKEGKRFIRLNSQLQYDLLCITMDNSFNGQVSTLNGRFRSSKRNAFGVGLTSIQSVARKFGGDADFHSEGTVFLSSIYINF